MIKLFYDLETTGLNYRVNGIHHISGIVDIDDEVVERFDFKVRPPVYAKIEAAALRVGGVTEAEIMAYPEMPIVYNQFRAMLKKYIDPADRSNKAYLCGYNNAAFDDFFLQKFFELNKDAFFAAYFFGSLDVIVLARQYLRYRVPKMPSFKLKRVALELGLVVDVERLHDAAYDVELTRQIYRIVTGVDLEI